MLSYFVNAQTARKDFMKQVNQQIIKNNNLKMIYNFIYQNQGISRSQLAKECHLSKTTISALADELIERNFIIDTGAADSCCVGRKPNSLHLRTNEHFVAVIFWSDKAITLQLIDICGMPAAVKQIPVLPDTDYVKASYDALQEQLTPPFSSEKLLGVCIVVPAMIDPDAREIFATTLPLLDNSGGNLIEHLEKTFRGYPLALLNDTACFAYAEKVYTHIKEKDFAFINFDVGIGATLFIQDTMLGKATASYTQFGHYSIDPKGKPCPCGNRGCLELMIGEDSLPERIAKAGNTSVLKGKTHITYKDLGHAATYGDTASRKALSGIAFDFSVALSNLVCTVHPKLIIIGGKGRDLGPLFLEYVKDCLQKTGFRRMLDSIQIRYGQLDENACFCGAMKYFLDIHYHFTQDITNQFFIG